MGMTQSTFNPDKQLSDSDISKNIQNLFNSSKKNFNDSVDSIQFNPNLTDSAKYDPSYNNAFSNLKPNLTGGYQSSRKRYQKYDISNIKQDGGNNFEPLSDDSNFNSFKKHLVRDNLLDNKQTGGGYYDDVDSLYNSIPSAETITDNNKLSFLDILKGGAIRSDDEESIGFDDDITEEIIDDDSFANSDDSNIRDVDIDDVEDYDLEQEKKNKNMRNLNQNSRNIMNNVQKEYDSYKKTYSETSVKTEDLNIVPFYSTDSDDYVGKHPYALNRNN